MLVTSVLTVDKLDNTTAGLVSNGIVVVRNLTFGIIELLDTDISSLTRSEELSFSET